jgi:WD40 repeat protein
MRILRSRYFAIVVQTISILIIWLIPTLPAAAQKSQWHITMHIGEGRIRDAQWTVDGSKVIIQTEASIYIYSSRLKFVGRLPESSKSFSVHSDSNRVAYITDENHTVAFWNIGENKFEYNFTHQDVTRFSDVEFSPDGKSIALLTNDGRLTIWDLATEHVTHSVISKNAVSLSWSPDGSRIVACGYFESWFCDLINPITEKTLARLDVNNEDSLVWRPDGEQFGITVYEGKT